MVSKIVDEINRKNLSESVARAFSIGDTIKVHVKIREGDKERIQVFAGTVIGKKGTGATETFTVRRISHGTGVERVFPVGSPQIAKIEVERSGYVRRAKLYFLRDKKGKKARLREKVKKSN